jgi:hypothetical protein
MRVEISASGSAPPDRDQLPIFRRAITGEIEVLEGARRLDAATKEAGVVLCPGAGFVIVPTYCIALMSMPIKLAHFCHLIVESLGIV